jgi:carotenoid cleavage dioxygenase-like enzyme
MDTATSATRATTATPRASSEGMDRELARRWFVEAWSPALPDEPYEITDVEGEIPREIHGTLFRNGPSQRMMPPGGNAALHLFDGDALVHAFRIDDGRAYYRGRFVENQSYLVEQEEGRFCMHSFMTRAENPTDRVLMRQQPNTNVVWHGGKLMAMVENAYPFEIDPKTLGPVGENDFGGKMLGMSTTAHPKIDGKTGRMIIHGYQPMEPYVQYYVVEPDGRCSLAEPVEMPYPAMMHDVAITENYVIFIVPPGIIDGEKLMTLEHTFKECFRWEPERGLRFAIRRREAGSPLQWFRVQTPGFIFHPGNAYEEDGKIVMDACTYRDGNLVFPALEGWRTGDVHGEVFAVPFLYEFDLASGECREKQLDDRGAEFPRLDDRLVGYKNRWGYAARARGGGNGLADVWGEIVRYDRQGGRSDVHDYGVGHFPNEPVFVPRSADAAEDDGFVLNVVYDAPNDKSYVAILDARNMAAEPLAKCHLKHRIPMGFHGNFAGGVV